MAEKEEFKTSLMGGYDKEDVDAQFQKLRDEAAVERAKLKSEFDERKVELEKIDARLSFLRESLEKKESEAMTLRSNIEGRYRSYIDNQDMIGRLAEESRVRAEEIRREADEERRKALDEAGREARQIRADAEADAKRIRDDAASDSVKTRDVARRIVAEQRGDGLARLEVTQEELASVVERFNRVQHHFMQSYKTIQEITNR